MSAIGKSGPRRLQAGGTLGPDQRYIMRPADRELLDALLAGNFCYVLAPRQIGKSSLRVRTQAALEQKGVRVVTVTLDGFGAEVTGEQWYFSFLDELSRELGFGDDVEAFWEERRSLTPVRRWSRYLRERALALSAPAPVVVFVDEIDTVLRLKFNHDDFFAAVRAVYNDRADHPDCRRLTFCLLGVAAPTDLITDPVRTPFNIGRRIDLRDFTLDEARGFAKDLSGLDENPARLIDEIYDWTAGHPYMTQRLCIELHRQSGSRGAIDVGRAVEDLFLRRGRSEDTLGYTEKRLEDLHSDLHPLLSLYRRLLITPEVLSPGDGVDRMRLELQLCGLIGEREGPEGAHTIAVRNKVFAKVFDSAWVQEKLRRRRLDEAVTRWQSSGRSPEALLRGLDLSEAQAWAKAHPQELTAEEHEFLRACLEGALTEEEQRRLAAEVNLARAKRKAEQDVLHTEQSLRAALLAERPERLMEALVVGMQAVSDSLPSHDFEARIWEGLVAAATAARTSSPFEGHTGAVSSVAFSPDGTLAATASSDGSLRLWQVISGELRFKLSPPPPLAEPDKPPLERPKGIQTVAFSPSGRNLVIASDDGTAYLWASDSGELACILKGHTGPVLSAAFSHEPELIATASADGTVRLWETPLGVCLRALEGHSNWVRSVAFSPDGRLLITASDDRTVRLWETHSGRLVRTFEAHNEAIHSAILSPDGRQLVSASADGTARLWETESGRFLGSLQGHQGAVFSAVFSPDGSTVATASADRTARLWDARSGRMLLSLQGHSAPVLDAAFSPGGETVMTGSADGTARLWEVQQGKLLRHLRGHSGGVLAAAFSLNSQWVATAGADGTVRVWEAHRERCLRVLEGHAGAIHSVRFSLDGESLLTGGADGTARLWEVHSGLQLLCLAEHQRTVHTVGFAPDGQTIVTADAEGSIRLWETRSGRLLVTLREHTDTVLAASFAPNGQLLITAGADGTARLWEMPNGRLLQTFTVSPDRVPAAAVSSNGQMVMTATTQGVVQFWEPQSGDPLGELRAPEESGQPRSAALSSDGQRVVTASSRGVVSLWDVKSGRQLLVLRGHTEAVNAVAFSPDGRHLVTASDDGSAIIHPTRHENFYIFACRVLGTWRDVPGVSDDALLERLLGACPEVA